MGWYAFLPIRNQDPAQCLTHQTNQDIILVREEPSLISMQIIVTDDAKLPPVSGVSCESLLY